MTPKFTVANATDWRTAEGVRAIRASDNRNGSFTVTFEKEVSIGMVDVQPWCVWTINSNGNFLYCASKGLVYDPVAKITPLAAFWLVWRPNGSNPSFRHPTETSAVREAERLAKLHGGEFFVLKMTSRSIVPTTPVQTTFVA